MEHDRISLNIYNEKTPPKNYLLKSSMEKQWSLEKKILRKQDALRN